MIHTSVQPPVSHLHRSSGILIITRVRGALIKSHDDIRPDGSLDLHHIFRSEEMVTSIDMTLKLHPFFFDFSIGRQRINLKSTTVREDASVPVDKFMKSPGFFNDIGLRS